MERYFGAVSGDVEMRAAIEPPFFWGGQDGFGDAGLDTVIFPVLRWRNRGLSLVVGYN
jgi:hypothetical protein